MITFRPATSNDFEIVYQFINLLESTTFDKESQRKIFYKNLDNDQIIYVLAIENEKAVGFVSCHIQLLLHHSGPIAEIQEMVVAETHRSKGVGNKLMEFLLNELRKRNIPQVEVTSNKKREDAHRFYLKENFADSHKKFTKEL
ncbi:MAG: GNAT family N-acetyltransferase [Crocinitomicaceae bacterium]|nr:GNAT family N-acetyltransferase [Crocinitomicaceae bacterium]